MTTTLRPRSYVGDPLLWALEKGVEIDRDILTHAIVHRQSRIRHVRTLVRGNTGSNAQALLGYADEWSAEITALKTARARMLAWGQR